MQTICYRPHPGTDPYKRDQCPGHIYFDDDCTEFCERWDRASFDPAYENLPCDHFAPMIEAVFTHTPYGPDVIRPGHRETLCSSKKKPRS